VGSSRSENEPVARFQQRTGGSPGKMKAEETLTRSFRSVFLVKIKPRELQPLFWAFLPEGPEGCYYDILVCRSVLCYTTSVPVNKPNEIE
jgi:hypothetical protein